MEIKFPIFDLPNDIILNIISYFNNYQLLEVIRIIKRSKKNSLIKKIENKYFVNYIENRNHPIVFNLLDNYCSICNKIGNTFFYLTKNESSVKEGITYIHCFHGRDSSHGVSTTDESLSVLSIFKNIK